MNFGRYFWFQHHGDVSWFHFFFWPFLFLALIGLGHAECDFRKAMPQKIRAYAPIAALDQAIEEARPEGYLIYQEGEYSQNPGKLNEIFIEYSLELPNRADVIEYKWSWTVPPDLLREKDDAEIVRRLNECVLTPLTEPAERLQPRVLEIMELAG